MIVWRGVYKLIEELNELGTELAKLGENPTDDVSKNKNNHSIVEHCIEEISDVQAALQYFVETNGLKIDKKRVKMKLERHRLKGRPGVFVKPAKKKALV